MELKRQLPTTTPVAKRHEAKKRIAQSEGWKYVSIPFLLWT